jgi:hypothetical protein
MMKMSYGEKSYDIDALKVDSNKKRGGLGRKLSLIFSLGLWRLRVICNLNLLFSCKTFFVFPPFPAKLIYRRCLDE